MSNTVNILEGSTFVTSNREGDINGTPAEPHGLFAFDTRFLSRWCLTIDGKTPAVLSTDDLNYYSAQFFLAPSTGSTYTNATLSVIRKRAIGRTMREDIKIMNHAPVEKTVELRIDVGADFADLFEVKDQMPKKGKLYSRVEDGRLVLGYRRDDYVRETWIEPSGAHAEIGEDSLTFKVELPPNGEWSTAILVSPKIPGYGSLHEDQEAKAEDRVGLLAWEQTPPTVQSDWRAIERVYEKSIVDLASVRLTLPSRPDDYLPAAGLPWFMAPFGRDSIITSYQAIPFLPELARGTIAALGYMQGSHVDDFRDEEPGKILHELRFGELTAFEERPHSPYFGAADSTTLWLILLDEYERWSGRADLVRTLEPQARAALDWIDHHGDRDGDGYIEYETRNKETGLPNQCWKDSDDSIVFSNGELASWPRATCELQGYAYDAKVRCARLAREIWGDFELSTRLEREAAELKQRFNRDFWLADRGYFGLALDGQKRVVDSLTSNIGHLLWSGIVDDDKAASVVQHLMSDRLFSGWGIRTMATGEAAYNPIGYHVGTVWPHDNSIIALGLQRYGYRREASQLAEAMIEVATFFDNRLPEAFAGYPRELTHYPAEYPTACSPQAWASGAPLAMIRVVLGLEPSGSLLKVEPMLPEAMMRLHVQGVPGRWGRQDAGADVADNVKAALGSVASQAPPAVNDLFRALYQGVDLAETQGLHTSMRFDVLGHGSWRIGIDNGRVEIGQSSEDADCILEMSEETLKGIVTGSQNARTAQLSGKIKVRGDWSIAAKLERFLDAGMQVRPEALLGGSRNRR